MLTFEGNAILGANDIVKKLVVREYFQNSVLSCCCSLDCYCQLETLTEFLYLSFVARSIVRCLHNLNL